MKYVSVTASMLPEQRHFFQLNECLMVPMAAWCCDSGYSAVLVLCCGGDYSDSASGDAHCRCCVCREQSSCVQCPAQ